MEMFTSSRKAIKTGYLIAGTLATMASAKIGVFYLMAHGSLLKNMEGPLKDVDWSEPRSLIAAGSALGVLGCLPTLTAIVPTWLWKNFQYSTLEMKIDEKKSQITKRYKTIRGGITELFEYDAIRGFEVKKQHWLQKKRDVGTVLVHTVKVVQVEHNRARLENKVVKIPFQDHPHDLAKKLNERYRRDVKDLRKEMTWKDITWNPDFS